MKIQKMFNLKYLWETNRKDSHACAEILLRYYQDGGDIKGAIRTCSFKK